MLGLSSCHLYPQNGFAPPASVFCQIFSHYLQGHSVFDWPTMRNIAPSQRNLVYVSYWLRYLDSYADVFQFEQKKVRWYELRWGRRSYCQDDSWSFQSVQKKLGPTSVTDPAKRPILPRVTMRVGWSYFIWRSSRDITTRKTWQGHFSRTNASKKDRCP